MPNFDLNCELCSRLSSYLAQIRQDYPSYHTRPVAPFGALQPKLLIVGLAPGMHGANATGRPFTGDHAGIMLYDTLFRFGFANKAVSTDINDGLKLLNCRITNAVKCLPPENKPISQEINTCNRYLVSELEQLGKGVVILALGRIAHNAVLKALNLKQKDYVFSHGQLFSVANGNWLLNSYHCSRYNTQTRRLTTEMFDNIFYNIVELLNITI
jgi:uracil-DNA glycosylase family 4